MNIVAHDNLKSGKRYKLTMSDCCIVGEVIARFVRYIDKDEDEWYSGSLEFDIGVFNYYSRVEFEELDD